jgi:hypothetical protein
MQRGIGDRIDHTRSRHRHGKDHRDRQTPFRVVLRLIADGYGYHAGAAAWDLSPGAAGIGRTIVWTAHDDEFSSTARSELWQSGLHKEGEPMSSSIVNFIAIIARRSDAMSLKPC